MRNRWRRAVLCMAAAAFFAAAVPAQDPAETQKGEVLLPSGKRQKDEILRVEHEQNVKDAAQLTELAQQLQQDLEKNDRFVFSIATLKKTEDIEKLARKIRSRMRHN